MTKRKELSQQALSFKVTRNNLGLLWCCQLINLSTLLFELSPWMMAIIALCLGWQAVLLNNRFDAETKFSQGKSSAKKDVAISPTCLKIIAMSGCVAIAITAKNVGVLISMLNLLALAYTLKTFEIKQRKDFYQVILLGLFLLACALIFKQTLAFSSYIILLLLFNITVLHRLFSPKKSLINANKTVGIMLLQSAFLATVLFITFPRLSPFWQVPTADSAKTGLSDKLSPGDIASLTLSNELAFRVDFKNSPIPAYSNLYWRAMTLENFDGTQWTRAKETKQKGLGHNLGVNTLIKPTTANSIHYEVTVEPSYQQWLFGLAVATSEDARLSLQRDYTIQSRNVLTQTTQYQVNSFLNSSLDLHLSVEEQDSNLSISKGSNPRLEKLATQLTQQYEEPLARAQAILDNFRESDYFYTLQAPPLNNNSLDQFYFDTKAGFCEHYASSFTYLMRAAGIPARIVTGYLGGEYNNVNAAANPQQVDNHGGHLSIYQYDAHAWSEIWLQGIGWKRIDPTAAVDPQRVESGWSNALLTQQFSLNNDLIGLYQLKNIAWLNTLRLQLDALDYQWTRWVLGYSSKRQYDLLKSWFGMQMPWKTATMVAVTLIIAMALVTLFYRFNFQLLRRKKGLPWVVLYQKLLASLASKGMAKPANMTVLDYSTLIAAEQPRIAKVFHEFSMTFVQLNYRKLTDKEKLKQMERLRSLYKQIKRTLSAL